MLKKYLKCSYQQLVQFSIGLPQLTSSAPCSSREFLVKLAPPLSLARDTTMSKFTSILQNQAAGDPFDSGSIYSVMTLLQCKQRDLTYNASISCPINHLCTKSKSTISSWLAEVWLSAPDTAYMNCLQCYLPCFVIFGSKMHNFEHNRYEMTMEGSQCCAKNDKQHESLNQLIKHVYISKRRLIMRMEFKIQEHQDVETAETLTH